MKKGGKEGDEKEGLLETPHHSEELQPFFPLWNEFILEVCSEVGEKKKEKRKGWLVNPKGGTPTQKPLEPRAMNKGKRRKKKGDKKERESPPPPNS